MPYRTIEDLSVDGKRVFLRLDLNVPLANGRVEDATRIEAALPSVRWIVEHGGIPILASHLGRPKGKRVPELSLEPVAAVLRDRLPFEVGFVRDCIGGEVEHSAGRLFPGQVLLLENLRFHAGEEKNDPDFSRALAALAPVYVNDAFGTAHRAHASTCGMVSLVSERAVGFLMQKEIESLAPLLGSPPRPFVLVLGGAKVSDKIGVVRNLFGKIDAVLIGGAMAYTFLRARGVAVGRSLVAEEEISLAGEILAEAEQQRIDFILPVDHVSVTKVDASSPVEVSGPGIPEGRIGVDVGPATLELYAEHVARARTVFWNGPLGVCEIEPFSYGTFSMAAALASSPARSIVGGGDSVAAVIRSGHASRIHHISTGGGASLQYLEGRELPGLEALEV